MRSKACIDDWAASAVTPRAVTQSLNGRAADGHHDVHAARSNAHLAVITYDMLFTKKAATMCV